MSYNELDCCGLAELLVGDICSKEQLEEDIRELRRAHHGAIFATTIARSVKYARVEKLLKRAGFRHISRFKNPNSGNILKFWFKTLGKPLAESRDYF